MGNVTMGFCKVPSHSLCRGSEEVCENLGMTSVLAVVCLWFGSCKCLWEICAKTVL